MIKIKDEVLDGVAKYRIRDAQGNIVMDNFTIEQITPVTQEGTRFNKTFFERFHDNIKSAQDLTWKWNQAKVAKMWDEYNYLTLDNEIDAYEKGMIVYMQMPSEGFYPFNESIIPLVDRSVGGGKSVAIGDFSFSCGYSSVYYAFDKDDATEATEVAKKYTITFSNFHIKVREYKVKAKRGQTSNDVSVYGVHEYKNSHGNTVEDETKIGAVPPRIGTEEPVVATYDGDEFFNYVYVDLTTSAHGRMSTFDITKGEISNMHANKSTYLNINNLGNVLVDTLLSYDKKYKLVYDGTVFHATEVTE